MCLMNRLSLDSGGFADHTHIILRCLVQSTVSGSNLFEYLDCLWEFNSGPTPNKTALNFRVDFQFRSPLYHRVSLTLQLGRHACYLLM